MQCPITDEVHVAQTANSAEGTQAVRSNDYVADFKIISEKVDKCDKSWSNLKLEINQEYM